MKRRICVNCEAEISDSTLICTNCGLPFKSYKYANNENIAQIILKGNTYYNKEEYEKAFYCYKEACDCGDPIGYMKLGDCFRIAYHEQNIINYEKLINLYGQKALDLYRFSCKEISNWSENRNRYLYMEMTTKILRNVRLCHDEEFIPYMNKAFDYLNKNILPSNLDCMGFDPFSSAIKGTIERYLDEDSSSLENVLKHPRSDKHLIVDACAQLVSDIFNNNVLTEDILNMATHYIEIINQHGGEPFTEMYYEDKLDWWIRSAPDREAKEYEYEERMRELEEQFAEEDAEEYIQQWEIEQDDSMPHDSDREYYYNMCYNDDFSYDDYEGN